MVTQMSDYHISLLEAKKCRHESSKTMNAISFEILHEMCTVLRLYCVNI